MLQAALPQSDVPMEFRRNPLPTYQEMLERAKYLALEEDDEKQLDKALKGKKVPLTARELKNKKKKDYTKGHNQLGYQASRVTIHTIQNVPISFQLWESFSVQALGKYWIGEGQSTSRPPLFDGTNYMYWKERMRIYIRSTNFQLWLVIKNGEETPMKKVGETLVPKTEDKFDAQYIKKVENYTKAINMLYCAVYPDGYRKICCTTAKEMWDKLEVTYEGMDQVREAKIDFFTQEYEMFRMKEDEKIDDRFDRFSKIINDLHALKKTYANKNLVRKILRSLTPEWRSKANTIYESIGVSNVTIDGLRGNVKTYESTILTPSLDEQKKKGIALKATKETVEEESSDEDNEFGLIIKKFHKFMKKEHERKGKKHDGPQSAMDVARSVTSNLDVQKPRTPSTNVGSRSNEHTSLGEETPAMSQASKRKTKKQTFVSWIKKKRSHPTTKTKRCSKAKNAKHKRGLKKQRAYISWGGDSGDESSEQEEDEEANLCLMDQEEEESSNDKNQETTQHTFNFLLLFPKSYCPILVPFPSIPFIMSNTSNNLSHEELLASNAALKAQVEYLVKQVAQLTKLKMSMVNTPEESDEEEEVHIDADSSNTTRGENHERGATDFKVDIPTFEGKNDPDDFSYPSSYG
ncbi:unnamed protein product [Cuscuta campestris]|uniref:DUF4219 domain-containing protein n=1 Tax=Cuscuta campestris TaxID=132261 RepID=A0A484KL60_9ASTE|nr:unnamed protein product [Cuscuta campestris]